MTQFEVKPTIQICDTCAELAQALNWAPGPDPDQRIHLQPLLRAPEPALPHHLPGEVRCR